MITAFAALPALLPESPETIPCSLCEKPIEIDQIVRPRYDYILCPHCGKEFIPRMFLL